MPSIGKIRWVVLDKFTADNIWRVCRRLPVAADILDRREQGPLAVGPPFAAVAGEGGLLTIFGEIGGATAHDICPELVKCRDGVFSL